MEQALEQVSVLFQWRVDTC